jgi:hypothetical protein
MNGTVLYLNIAVNALLLLTLLRLVVHHDLYPCLRLQPSFRYFIFRGPMHSVRLVMPLPPTKSDCPPKLRAHKPQAYVDVEREDL